MKKETDNDLEIYQMLSGKNLGELKFYEKATYWEFEREITNPYGDGYHFSDGKHWDKVHNPALNETTWHEKTYRFSNVEHPELLSGKKSIQYFKDPYLFTLRDMERSKMDFWEYTSSGGKMLSMNYTKAMAFEGLPKNIKEIITELHKRAGDLMKVPLNELDRVGVPTKTLISRPKDVESLANGERTEPFKLHHKKTDLIASFQMVKDKDGVARLTAYPESKFLNRLINDIKKPMSNLEQPTAVRKSNQKEVFDLSR